MATIPPRTLLTAFRNLRGGGRADEALARAVAEEREHPERAGERLGDSTQDRPEGPLVWLHAADDTAAADLPHLVERLRAERDEVHFLVTTGVYDPDHPLQANLPDGCLHQYLPYDTGPGAERFLRHWRPDVALWADPELQPGIIEAAADAGVTLHLINAHMPDEVQNRLRWFPGPSRAALARFQRVLAADGRSAGNLRRLGLPSERVEVTGYLQEGAPPLPCNQTERDTLGALLAARPVWLAAGVGADEIPAVMTAHRRASRRAHRLLLILVPDERSVDEKTAAEELDAEGWITARRAAGEEPDPEIQIYVAEADEEMGLWYRLSPISFVGGTLGQGAGRDPFEATALGSAVLHGPNAGPHGRAYERLRGAGAARCVRNAGELANELDLLLAPDKAAEMARAAWEVSTAGAEATDRVIALICAALDDRGR